MNLIVGPCMRFRDALLLGNCCLCAERCRVRRWHSKQACKTKDFYDVLEISHNADQRDVKSAFYKLSKRYHPDSNFEMDSKAAASKFQEINEAYETLGNVQKRSVYDDSLRGSTGVEHSPGSEVNAAYMKEFQEFQRRMRIRRYTPSAGPGNVPPPDPFEGVFRHYQENAFGGARRPHASKTYGDDGGGSGPWGELGYYQQRRDTFRREMYARQYKATKAANFYSVIMLFIMLTLSFLSSMGPQMRRARPGSDWV